MAFDNTKRNNLPTYRMIKKIILIFAFGLLIIHFSCTDRTKIQISSYSDGPYIIEGLDSSLIIYQNHDYSFDSLMIAKSDLDKIEFTCDFDSIDCPSLSFRLKKEKIETTDSISLPDKLIAISDIEGNFENYYQLLIANNVIDTNYNWTFGAGHLVIVGDLVDRGDYVTQCLWLTYHLEQEAEKYGGKVHYLLGNHEQIVLLGYDDYSSPKYHRNFETMRKGINQLFSEETAFGKWLREKNSILKSGDIIFVHGGISPEILKYDLPLQKINTEIKRDIATQDFKSNESIFLLTELGVLWYRGLVESYEDYDKISKKELDSVLSLLACNTIAIGHTPVDSISNDFQGKVIRLDVNHYENSSALLIENAKMYIVDSTGNKKEL